MTVLEPQTLKHLAFIRLLYEQGMEQTALPEPMCFASLLTFHDSVELFLVLTADHTGATLPRRDPNFLEYWQILRRTDTFPRGVDLSGQPGMDRLNRHRNMLKHAGAFPGRDAVDGGRASVTAFFDDNTPRVFAVDFAAIDMAYVVPQDTARDRLRAAAAAEVDGDRVEAMAQLAEAFAELFYPYTDRGYGSYAFGSTVREHVGFAIGVESAMTTLASGNHRRGLISIGSNVDQRITELTNAVAAMQRGMRVLALGIDYGRYDRFERLTPRVWGQGERRQVSTDAGYAPTREEYDYCVQFVVTVSLRIAEVEANAVPVSWRPRWPS